MISLDCLLLGSVLLEPSRWSPGRVPSLQVSTWSPALSPAGFDGWELWENHYLLADPGERARLRSGEAPVRIFNSYAGFGPGSETERAAVLSAICELGVRGCKFNVPADPALLPVVADVLDAFASGLPASCRLLCECHAGTAVDTPGTLAAWMRRWSRPPFDIIVHPFSLTPEELSAWFDAAGDHIRHLHLQVASPSGRGRIRLEAAGEHLGTHLEVLTRCRFRGSATVEFTAGVAEPPEDPSQLFAAAVSDARWIRTHFS